MMCYSNAELGLWRGTLQKHGLLLYRMHTSSNLFERSFKQLCGTSVFNAVEMMYSVRNHHAGNELWQKYELQCGYFGLNKASQSVCPLYNFRQTMYLNFC